RSQRTICFIRSIRKAFSRNAKTSGCAGSEQFRVRQPKQNQILIERGDCASDRISHRAIAARHVVERAMRLHVLQPQSFCSRNARDRGDLIQDEVFNVLRRGLDLTASETDEISESWMRTDRNAVPLRQTYGVA